jgi:membrane protein implicated in regulation of membrane protease activity
MEALKEFFSPEIIWFILGLAMLLSEFIMPGLIIAFFGFGVWVVAILCLIIPEISINLQLFIFIISSVVLLLALRNQVAKVFKGFEKQKNIAAEDVDDFIGHRATVVIEIGKNKNGKIEFHGTNWNAAADVDIAVGEMVEIIGKDSITLKVKTLN